MSMWGLLGVGGAGRGGLACWWEGGGWPPGAGAGPARPGVGRGAPRGDGGPAAPGVAAAAPRAGRPGRARVAAGEQDLGGALEHECVCLARVTKGCGAPAVTWLIRGSAGASRRPRRQPVVDGHCVAGGVVAVHATRLLYVLCGFRAQRPLCAWGELSNLPISRAGLLSSSW